MLNCLNSKMFTRKALAIQHERDKGIIEELNDTINWKDELIREQQIRLRNLRKKRGLLNIQKAYMDSEILEAVRKIQGRHIRIRFLTLIEKILDWLRERF
jgi:hypothetical protein